VKGARLGVDATGKPYAAGGRYGLYFRERLGPGRADRGDQGPDASDAAPAPTGPPRGSRWWLVVGLAVLIGLVVGVLLAPAGEPTRVDLFDAQGQRTAFGRVDSPGKAERFGLDGMRQGETAVPIAPKVGAPR
jgi:hypothetical protein